MRGGEEANEGDEVGGEAGSDLPELVLDVLVFGQDTLCCSLLLLVDQDGCSDARQDQTVEQRECECLVLARDDGSKEDIHNRQANDTDLAHLQAPKTRRRFSGEGEEERHLERSKGDR